MERRATDWRSTAVDWSGAAAVCVTVGGIMLATVLSPTFSWTHAPLSELGVEPGVAWIFNGGLVGGALIGLPFAYAIATEISGWKHSVIGVTLAVGLCFMAAVGVFPMDSPLHSPVAVAFYLTVTALFAIDGLLRLRTRAGKISLAFVPIHMLGWILWGAGYFPGPGLALPELYGALLFSIWVVVLSPKAVVSIET